MEILAEAPVQESISPIEDAIQEAVEEATCDIGEIADVALTAEMVAETALEIAEQAADEAALNNAILAEEFRAWQTTSAELHQLQSAQILALETTLSATIATLSEIQTQLLDYQTTLSTQLSSPETKTTEQSTQTPHTEEKQTEHHESGADAKPEADKTKSKDKPAQVKKRKVLWG